MIRYQILQVDMHYKFSSGEHCLSLSRVHLFAAPRTVACQAPLSMKLPRQEYWKDCHFLLNGLFLTQGSNPGLLLGRWILYPWATWDATLHVMRGRSVVSGLLWPRGLQPSRILCPWEFSRQEYWSGLPCPPPGDLFNPGIESRSPALQMDFFYHLSHQGSPRILAWVAYPFSPGTSWPRNRTGVPTLQEDSLPAELPRENP